MVNASGLTPYEYKVIIKPEKVDERTSGGIYIPPEARSKQQLAEVKSTLVAVGGNAFEDWKGDIPQVGDKVYVAKYAGIVVRGKDNEEYRICQDKDLSAGIEE